MEGDFTRSSDDSATAYTAVLMQQGRVQLDADWNEQVAIQTRALRAMLRDLIGPYGGPNGNVGFGIAKADDTTLTMTPGVYYVDGIRVEQPASLAPAPSMSAVGARNYVVYLDVWERHVNAIEDPRIREVALLGPDTATRTELLWRVRLLSFENSLPSTERLALEELVREELTQRPRRRLAARALTVNPNADPCQLSPDAKYRGRENQLYRVQIHEAWPPESRAAEPEKVKGKKKPVKKAAGDDLLFTFKWSRDNGSVVFPIVGIPEQGSPAAAGDAEIEITVQLGNLGRDDRFSLAAGDIVEFVHDALTRETLDDGVLVDGERDPGRAGLLGRVLAPIDRDELTVPIAVYAPDIAELPEISLHPYLRRWDQSLKSKPPLVRGAVPVRVSDLGKWLALENGVEVLFEAKDEARDAQQRAGDYWQIPARTAIGDVLWPRTTSGAPAVETPVSVRPHGPHHHYAPLAVVHWDGSKVTFLQGMQRSFEPLAGQ